MSRIIKFRAWHIAESKMCDVELLRSNGAFLKGVLCEENQIANIGGKAYEVIAPDDGRFCDVAEFHLMQYTGLHDKNDKEIYEGDILKRADNHHQDWKLLVSFNEHLGFVGTTYPDKAHVKPLSYMMNHEGAQYEEIIGNIHQNPELLNEKQKIKSTK